MKRFQQTYNHGKGEFTCYGWDTGKGLVLQTHRETDGRKIEARGIIHKASGQYAVDAAPWRQKRTLSQWRALALGMLILTDWTASAETICKQAQAEGWRKDYFWSLLDRRAVAS